MNTYSIYDQRFNRILQSTLKTLTEIQARRKKEIGVNLRIGAIFYNYNKINNIPWNPADDWFVFSPDLLDRQFALVGRQKNANTASTHFATGEELDAFIVKAAM